MQPSNMIKILQQHKTSSGISFQEHIRDLIKRLSKDKTKLKGYDHFEILSQLLKQTKFVYHIPKTDEEVNNIKENKCELSEWIEKSKRLYKTDEWNKEKLHQTILQNVIADSKILEQAGISFGELKLASKVNTPELRFWGKIFGLKKDYFIAEGYAQTAYSDQVPVDVEPKGTGINKLTFWVTNDLLEEWIELPLITPQQMLVARKIKHMFTGDLNCKIEKYPVFNGLEKHLLKAQLVRISHSTVIVPRSLYKVQDENGIFFQIFDKLNILQDKEIEFEEEFKFPEQSELPALETWQHLHANILNAGRVSHYVDMNLPEEERNTQLDDLQTADPIIDRLKIISEDKPFEGFETNWLVKTLGETTQHNGIGKEEGQNLFYTTYVIRNLTWPGAFCLAQANSYVNIYIGTGMKQNQQSFFPQTPNNIGIEPTDQVEHPEPNGKDPKVLAAEEAEKERKRLEELEAEQND